MESAQRFIKRFLGFSIGPVLNAIIGFLWVPIVTRLILPEHFGKASLYTTATNLITLICLLGLDRSYVREYNSASDKKQLLLTSLTIPLAMAVFVGILCNVFYRPISLLLFETVERRIITILALQILISTLNRFYELEIRMSEKAFLYSKMMILKRLLIFIISLFLVLVWKKEFKSIIIGNFIAIAIYNIIAYLLIKPFKNTRYVFEFKKIIPMLKYGTPLLFSSMLVWILNSMDKIALRRWTDFSEIGLYAGAFKIVSLLIVVQQAFVTFWTPTAYRWHEEGIEKKKFTMVNDYIMVVMCMMFSIFVLMRKLLVLFLAKEFHSVYTLIPFLIIVPVMNIASETTCLGINFSRKTIYKILVFSICSLSNLLGNVIMVPRYGMLGAAISTGLSYIIMYWAQSLISRRLWYDFPVLKLAVNTALIVFISFLTLFKKTILWELLPIIGMIIINRTELAEIYRIIRKMKLFSHLIKKRVQ